MSVAIILALLAACILAQAFSPYFLACCDEGDRSNVDEHGIDRTPGREPTEVGLP